MAANYPANVSPGAPPISRRQVFFQAVRAETPILLGVVPFGIIFGALAVNAQLPRTLAQATSAVIFAGSAQFIAAQLIGAGASALVIVLVVFVVNLRHALYSASVAPYIQHLSPAWKSLLAYLLTDEAYVVTITHFNRNRGGNHPQWYFLGAGLTLWAGWQLSTAAGIFLGARLPPDLPLDFALPLTFIALVVPSLRDRASLAAALVAGLAGLLAVGLPLRTGLLLAAFAGILAGLLVEGRQP